MLIFIKSKLWASIAMTKEEKKNANKNRSVRAGGRRRYLYSLSFPASSFFFFFFKHPTIQLQFHSHPFYLLMSCRNVAIICIFCSSVGWPYLPAFRFVNLPAPLLPYCLLLWYERIQTLYFHLSFSFLIIFFFPIRFTFYSISSICATYSKHHHLLFHLCHPPAIAVVKAERVTWPVNNVYMSPSLPHTAFAWLSSHEAYERPLAGDGTAACRCSRQTIRHPERIQSHTSRSSLSHTNKYSIYFTFTLAKF